MRSARGVRILAAVVATAAAAAGCGPRAASCEATRRDFRLCTEWLGHVESQEAALREQCTSRFMGTFRGGSCARAGAAGGCRAMEGEVQYTTWFYGEGVTLDVEGLRSSCEMQGGMFVTP